MARRSEFADWLCEQLSPLGSMTARGMFGGWGIYCDGLIVALIIEEVCYLKTDAQTVEAIKAAGSEPFCYSKKDGKLTEVAYWRVPDEAMEDRSELLRWARDALAASLRAQAKKAGGKRVRAALVQ
jgi:DNA transformation protein